MASQMADARGRTVSRPHRGHRPRRASTRSSPRRAARSRSPATSGPTSRAATTPRPSWRTGSRSCRRWPEGDVLPLELARGQGPHHAPPARYTEASLVKRMEELGIGRPSTYASIIGTIQDRGYVWKKGTALVPTWTAFAVDQPARGALRRPRRLRVHRPHGGRPRRDRPGPARQREPWLARLLVRQRHGPGLARLVDEGRAADRPRRRSTPSRSASTRTGRTSSSATGRYGPY